VNQRPHDTSFIRLHVHHHRFLPFFLMYLSCLMWVPRWHKKYSRLTRISAVSCAGQQVADSVCLRLQGYFATPHPSHALDLLKRVSRYSSYEYQQFHRTRAPASYSFFKKTLSSVSSCCLNPSLSLHHSLPIFLRGPWYDMPAKTS